MMSVSLFRFWRANRSYLMMFGGGDLALERILVTCGYYLLVLGWELVDSIGLIIFFFGIFLGATIKLGQAQIYMS